MKELSDFLKEANKYGYASGNPGVKNEDGSTTISYPPEGDIDGWRLVDHFYGGEPYAGQEVVFKDGKPYWTMVYYGSVKEGQDLSIVYSHLQKALQHPNFDLPVRGPEGFSKPGISYKNQWQGNLTRFSGHETIDVDSIGNIIYEADYMGGLVDQVRE